jgi:hypothetical protein
MLQKFLLTVALVGGAPSVTKIRRFPSARYQTVSRFHNGFLLMCRQISMSSGRGGYQLASM